MIFYHESQTQDLSKDAVVPPTTIYTTTYYRLDRLV